MPSMVDSLRMLGAGINFSDAVELGITNASDQAAYPEGLTAMWVPNADGWPTFGTVLTMNTTPYRFSQIFIAKAGNWVRIRGLDGNGPGLSAWQQIDESGWTDLSLTNGWENYSSSFHNAGYRIDRVGIVRLKGLVRNGTMGGGGSIATLPSGYTPIEREIFGIASNNSVGRVDVTPAGALLPYSPGTNGWISLDGISFSIY